jgi:excisionase family DNA binding protein
MTQAREKIRADNSGDQPAEVLADGLLTVNAAAKFLAVGKTKLYGEMDAGRLPFCKFGRARRIPRRALIAYAESNLRGGWAMQSHTQFGGESRNVDTTAVT